MALIQRNKNEYLEELYIGNSILFTNWEIRENTSNSLEINNNGTNAISFQNSTQNITIQQDLEVKQLFTIDSSASRRIAFDDSGSNLFQIFNLQALGNGDLTNFGTNSNFDMLTFDRSNDSVNINTTNITLTSSNLTTVAGDFYSINTGFFLDASNGNVGIGTSTPSTKLDVNGIAYFRNNVGIKTTTPSTDLDVNGKTYFRDIIGVGVVPTAFAIELEDTINNTGIQFKHSNNTTGTLMILDNTGDFNINQNDLTKDVKINIGNEKLDITNTTTIFTNNNVGIGTTPTVKLQVAGSVYINQDNSAFAVDGASNGRLGFIKRSGFGPMIASSSGNDIIFSNSDQSNILNNISTSTLTELMRLTSAGNLGIGTNAPSFKLDVNGTFRADNGQAIFRAQGNSYVIQHSTGNLQFNNPSTSNVQMLNSAGGYLSLADNTGDVLYVKSGNVGIGTTNPIAPLDILHTGIQQSAVIRSSDSLRSLLYFQNSTTGNTTSDGSYIGISSDEEMFISQNENLAMIFKTNASERMRIDNNGNVGIGVNIPGETLEVRNGNFVQGLFSSSFNSGGIKLENFSKYAFEIQCEGPTVNRFIIFDRSLAAYRFVITSAGNVGLGGLTAPVYQLQLSADSAGKPTTNTWTITSDKRLKENIQVADYNRCYEDVKKLDLKYYKWKDEYLHYYKETDKRKIGWIADDVEMVYPKCVKTIPNQPKKVKKMRNKKNELEEDILDEDGNLIEEEYESDEDWIEDCKTLNTDLIYASMYGALRKVIDDKELLEKQRIKDLEDNKEKEQRIKDLETRIKDLETDNKLNKQQLLKMIRRLDNMEKKVNSVIE